MRDIWDGQSRSVEETVRLGEAIGSQLRGGDVLGLIGQLGAGKTQFVRGLARGMGIDDTQVSSPTFVMVQEYTTCDATDPDHISPDHASLESPLGLPQVRSVGHCKQVGQVLVHVDAYRLDSLDDLESIGWQDLVGDSQTLEVADSLAGSRSQPTFEVDCVLVVEWADRLTGQLGNDRIEVEITHEGESHRRLRITPYGSWCSRMTKLVAVLDQVVVASTSSVTLPSPPERDSSQLNDLAKLSPRPVKVPSTDHTEKARSTACPICQQKVVAGGTTYPFCSQRCRQIDLSRWLGGRYVISRPINASDLDEV